MINLTANPNRGADPRRPDVCLNSLMPLARDVRQGVASVRGFPSAHDVASTSGSASKNAVVLLRSNVHQNVHQRIKKDRTGYVQIRPDFYCKCLIISSLYSDSDPRLHLKQLLLNELDVAEGRIFTQSFTCLAALAELGLCSVIARPLLP
jgi:hypothetical protein